MAIKRKTRYARRKPASRTRYRRRYKPKSTTSMFKTVSMATVPDRLLTKMAYSESFTLVSTTTPAYRIFQSSLYDPRYTTGGHQPLGRDQWAAFYNHYKVHGIKYRISFINTSTTDQVDVFALPKNTANVVGTLDTLWEKSYGKHRVLGVEGSGGAVTTISGYMSCAKTLGRTKNQWNSEKAYGSDMGNDPAQLAFLHFYSQAADGATSVTVLGRVQLVFFCELSEKVSLTAS